MTSFVADRSLQRLSSSFMKHAVDRPSKSLSKEHSGLMSWPESFYKPNKQKQNSAGPSGQANTLSSRALHLSMFGSVVGTQVLRRSFLSNIKVEQAQSLSYPIMPMNKIPPLVSVKSEGAASYGKNKVNRIFPPENQTGGLLNSTNMPGQSSHVVDDSSSDESGAEDEVIVRIDSPSTLSFPQGHPL